MKQLHFSFMAIFFALFAMVSFTACSSSDDDVPTTECIKANIVGMWQTTHVSGWTYDDTEYENLTKINQDIADKSELAERMLFKGDGTCYRYCYSTYLDRWLLVSNNYTYDISGDRIIVYNKTSVEQTYTVLSLKDDVVVLQYCMEEGEEYKTTITCKRVNY